MILKFISSKKVWVVLTFVIITLTGFNTFMSPPPGLENPEAIGAFINGNLPEIQPAGDIVTTPIYDNIEWESPIVATPFPQSNNILIVEMDGRFFTLSNDESTVNRTTVLDIQERTWYYDWNGAGTKHGGIQNAVFHPQFGLGQGKDYIYVYYLFHPNDASNSASASAGSYDRLSRFTWQGGSFDPNSELIMINQYDTARGHDGSGLTFGNDGFLYVSVGDEGSQNAAATSHTQKIDDRFRSGVWRIDVDQQGGNISHPINRQPSNANVPAGQTASYTQGYYIPNDNPWVNPDGSTLEEFYAIGLRQPFRMTLDPPTGNFWIGDVGSQQREEVDLMDVPGLNFEWNYKEGTAEGFRPLPNPYIGTARPPIHEIIKTGSMAIIGGYVYRGNNIPNLYGKYIFGNNGTGEIFSLSHTVGNSNDGVELIAMIADQGSLFNGISSFGQNHDNELLVLKLGKGVLGDGKIYRLTENTTTIVQEFPDQLSDIGIFSDLNNLTPVQGIIPYDVNNPLWSAGTVKKRWVAIPNDGNVDSADEQIDYSENGNWTFPIGTVFIKHFEQPDGKKLETRVWIHGTDDKWFGSTYKWNAAGTDADLLLAGVEEEITIEGETFTYLYPSVTQCQTCHTPNSGDVLGFRTHQLNRDIFYPTTGLVGNQLETLTQLGFIPTVNTNTVITSYANGNNSESLESRARSYFDSNCSHCHQPGGNRAIFDARYNTPLAQQALINGELIEDLGIADGKVIVPQHIDLSILYQRINSTEGCCAMPPLAKGRIDKEGVQLVANWINSLEADCAGSSATILGNTLSDGNFIDGHKPALNINKSDIYTNNTSSAEEICLIDFSFYARRIGNPVTPFIVKVNGNNDFTTLAIGETRTSTEYIIGNNSFPFSSHSDDVIILLPGETIATGFLDAYPDGSDGNFQSVIPAQSAAGEDNVWQTYSTNSLRPSVTLGEAPGQAASVAVNLSRTYKFNIGIDVSEVPMPSNTIDCGNPQNLAIGKTATQSSTYANSDTYSASNAIDGDTNGVHSSGSMTHTLFDQNAWWEIDLGKVYDLSTIKLWNRTDCCADRLSDFYVLVSDEPFSTQALSTTITQSGVDDFHFLGTAGLETNIDLNRTGRYLRVQLSGTNALQLAEVEIVGCDVPEPINCSNPQNIATGKTATQSSTYANSNTYSASNAIDGDTNGVHSSGSMTHTLFDQNAWWEIDLGKVYDLSTIKLWNRTDCCADRLSDFYVLVSDEPFSTQALSTTITQSGVDDFHFLGTAGLETNINLNRTGRYLRVQLSGTNALQLAEVEIFGCEVVEPIDCSNPENITSGKTATQSSIWANNINSAGAANAIDGSTNGTYPSGSLSHTLFDQNAWWEIDLETVHDLSSIKIWNRTDCCAERLTDFHVLVSDEGFSTQVLSTTISQNGVSDFHFPGTAGLETDIELNRTGRYLRIQLSGTNALQLAEVEIMGCPQAGTTLFADCNYGGQSISLVEGEYPNILNEGFPNDVLSSLVVPVGFQVILYQNYNFGGNSITLTADDACLNNDNFDNTSSSLKIIDLSNTLTAPICQCASGANSILVNGSFEETSNPAYNSAYDLVEAIGNNNSGVKFVDAHPDTDFPGWFTTGGIALQQGGFSQGGTLELGQSGFLGLEAPDGDIYAEMDGNNHDQIITVTPGQLLDWELTHRGREVGFDEISVSVGPVGNQTVIANLSSPNTAWTTHSGQYQVPAGVSQIQFTITPVSASNGDIDSSNLLDNVKVCPSNATTPPTETSTETCGGATLITYGNGSITMEGGSFFQVFDASWNQVYNCGWQCASSVTVNALAAGDYRVFIKDASYQIICEKLITLSANNGGDPDNDGDGVVASQDCNDNDPNLTTVGATCNDGNNNTENDIVLANCTCVGTSTNTGSNTTCGEVAITYGGGTISFEGLANNNYFFKVNDLNDNWAVVGSCSWNCGNQFTVNDLSNSTYLLTIYNSDWTKHCDTEIEMTGGGIRAESNKLFVSADFGQNAKLEWYFLQREDRKVRQYIIQHGTNNYEEMRTIDRVPASDIFGAERYDYLHDSPVFGINLYQVIVEYEDGGLDYSMNGDLTFDFVISSISIAPNPTQNSLKIDLSNYKDKSIAYSVNTLQGDKLLEGAYEVDHADVVELDLKNIPNGIYILYVKPEGHKAIALKFVVAKGY